MISRIYKKRQLSCRCSIGAGLIYEVILYTLIVIYCPYMSKSTNPHLALENLFGSKLRVKILKFLFRNYPSKAGVRDLAKRVQEPYEAVKKEMKLLERMGLVKSIK